MSSKDLHSEIKKLATVTTKILLMKTEEARRTPSGKTQVRVYRAKHVDNPRPESEAKIGVLVDAQKLLNDLRTNPGVEPALGIPPGPNSGLSVQLF